MTTKIAFTNPFRPGAGHMPPYLAGREHETKEFLKLTSQSTILENMVLTGLRGVGKTVLLDTFKPLAIAKREGNQLAVRVHPALLPALLPAASILRASSVAKKSTFRAPPEIIPPP